MIWSEIIFSTITFVPKKRYKNQHDAIAFPHQDTSNDDEARNSSQSKMIAQKLFMTSDDVMCRELHVAELNSKTLV